MIYKKRLDGVMVSIGEAILHEDKEQWDIDFIEGAYNSEKESLKTNSDEVNKYDKYFYILDEGQEKIFSERCFVKLDVSPNYYEIQLYIDKEFTITTGVKGYMSLPSYYDFFSQDI